MVCESKGIVVINDHEIQTAIMTVLNISFQQNMIGLNFIQESVIHTISTTKQLM